MNLEKIIFGFFILMAATLNLGFVYGDIDNPAHHQLWELYAAIVVNLIATVLKCGDRTHIGAVHLSFSLVALIQLAAAALVWFFSSPGADSHPPAFIVATIVSLSVGALLANFVSLVIMIVEISIQRR